MKTNLNVKGKQFLINGSPVYSELPNVNPASLGLLWNQRLIQGVFDDKNDRSRFNLFKDGIFDPDRNTDNLIAALPAWHSYGLRGFTVGFQGGWPVGCVDADTISNNPFGKDGKSLDQNYATRMDRIIKAADGLGMAVIVSILYWAQANELRDGRAVTDAVKTACSFLKDGGYTNVIVEVANEYNIQPFSSHPIVHSPEGMAQLLKIARAYSGGMLIGSSGGGAAADKEVIEESDVAIVHGNGATRGGYFNFLLRVKDWAGEKPVICNEDSPCISRIDVALETYTSWGYYNNYNKQIPPADFGVMPGEDLFFARRMARAVGIPLAELPAGDQVYLQGLEDWTLFHGRRAVRVAAEFPERIDYVDFFLNGQKIYRSYDEPFFFNQETTWLAVPHIVKPEDETWKAVIVFRDGNVIEKSHTL